MKEGYIKTNGKEAPGQYIAEEAVRTLLTYLGDDPTRDGLRDTPARVLKALREMTTGLSEDPKDILSKRFKVCHDELILLKNIPFTSLCEHHILPFDGIAAVAYIPKPCRYHPFTDEREQPIRIEGGGEVVGLSKLARLVQCFARRPQVQERLTGQIADSIMEHLKPVGAACVIKAEHSCLACRGARLPGCEFVTSALRGVLRNDTAARSELMSLIRD